MNVPKLETNSLIPVPSGANFDPKEPKSLSPFNHPVIVSKKLDFVNVNIASASALEPSKTAGSTEDNTVKNGKALIANLDNSEPNLPNDSPPLINEAILSKRLAPVNNNNEPANTLTPCITLSLTVDIIAIKGIADIANSESFSPV